MTSLTHFRNAAVLGIVAAAFLAACTPGGSDPSPTPTLTVTPSPAATPTATPTVNPETAAAEAAILEAYQGYWDAKVASFADPMKDQNPNLQHFAVDTALADAQEAILSFRSNGIAVVGEPELAPVVSDITLGEVKSATITDCVDITNWQPIYAATGDPAAPADQNLRVPTESTAYFFDGHWTIRASVVDREQTC
ncbi:MAG TPA: hypothetical protein VGK17_07190 [Propionicimonas sp.]|jgi:hypothetical protein